MSSNAQRDLYEDLHELPLAATGTDGGAALRRIAAERLAAHRTRRASSSSALPDSSRADRRVSETTQRVRDAVAARYRQTPSYQEALATQPPPPTPEPQRSAEPQLPAPIPAQRWIDEPLVPVEPVAHMEPVSEEPRTAEELAPVDDFFTDAAPVPSAIGTADGSFQVRPYERLASQASLPERSPQPITPTHPDELQELDEEIAFRLAPEFNEHFIEPLPIQANIIEFPRQLVAARKARPRLAEGPLRSHEEPATPEPSLFDPAPASDFQMRIFEVDSRDSDWSNEESVAEAVPEPDVAPAITEQQAPEWQHLVLDARRPDYVPRPDPTPASEPELSAPPVARFELRLMSAFVDAACIGMAFVVFATITALTTDHALQDISLTLLIAACAALLLTLTVLYQAMFFSLGASTPGMYYAHLEFRTLAGRQPSRGLMRRRITANLLTAAPVGISLLGSLIDGRSLGWNDRLSGVFLQEL